MDQPLRAFIRAVGARSAAPGGGSVAAASAAMVSGAWGKEVGGGDGGARPEAGPMISTLSPGRRPGLHGRPDDLWAAPV